jgi:hypothetical protein
MQAVDMTWAGGEHAFLLTIDHLRALQDRCDAGPAYVLRRLVDGSWRVDDVIQPIRLGLEGGGMEKDRARALVRHHVEDRPLSESVLTAQAVLTAMLYMPSAGDDGKKPKPQTSGARKRTRAS